MYTIRDSYDTMIDAMISFAKIRKEKMNDWKKSRKDNLKNSYETHLNKKGAFNDYNFYE